MNIIDFLGILLPGAFLFMLIGGDLDLWSFLGAYWGGAESTGTGIRITVLLTGGYITGSLIQEAGDLLERVLWTRAVFDPRSYAARNVKLHWDHLSGSAPVCQDPKKFLYCVFPLGIIWYGLLPIEMEFCRIVAIFVTGFILMWLGEKSLHDKLFQNLAGLDWIRDSDAIFLAHPEQEDYKIRKRMLFDGFRAMSRNMFIALAILKVYAHIDAKGSVASLLAAIGSRSIYSAAWLTAQLLLLVRYYRYSYLKFKYCYEDYLSGT